MELGILRKLRDACFEQHRPVSLALNKAFRAAFQESLDKYMSKRFVLHPPVLPYEKLKAMRLLLLSNLNEGLLPFTHMNFILL